VPRDVEVEVRDVDGCALLDLDDLHAVISRNVALRRREARAAEHMCAEAAAEYRAWSAARAVVPTVEDIRERGERIRRAEVERAAARWPDITDEERERIERLSRSIVGKLLHGPTVQLRADAAEPDALGRAETARRLFGLDEPDA
jgi:glutamyl-tRNA reductase